MLIEKAEVVIPKNCGLWIGEEDVYRGR